jgi:hypothetical protein
VSEAGQLDLLSMPVDPLPARRDQPTSRAAARALPIRARQQECLSALRWIGVSATADDVRKCLLEHNLDRARNEVASRLSELADPARWPDGPLVRRVGVKANARGRGVATFVLTEAGRALA